MTFSTHRLTWLTRRMLSRGVLSLGLFTTLVISPAGAQEQLPNTPTPQLGQPVVPPQLAEANEGEAAAQPVTSNKLNLEACIQLALEHQPALAAARSSLASAQSASRGVNSIGGIARLLAHDLPVRRTQACLGIQIANHGLIQAEWETRYAVTRNYYSVIYARSQTKVVGGLVRKLDDAVGKAADLVKIGDPMYKVTTIDVQTLTVNRDIYRARQLEASVGVDRAMAALREAIGVRCNFQLDIIDDSLPAIVENLDKDSLISMALAMRGEMAQAQLAHRVTGLEIDAQQRMRAPATRTFASGADIHAKPIPYGHSNGEYSPQALGPEMPVNFAGKKETRVARARDLTARAGAVVEKTEGLIELETEAAYYKWSEALQRYKVLANNPGLAKKVADSVQGRFDQGNVSGEELLRARTMEDQARANLNEALYNHALGLAALERVTAGGFRIPGNAP